jgi:hypothetical protein
MKKLFETAFSLGALAFMFVVFSGFIFTADAATEKKDKTGSQVKKAEHPKGEHPKADSTKKAEHPKGEHPKGEHPKGEHPKADSTKKAEHPKEEKNKK